jgi:2-oxoglutarate ferredoxin oxidoreductase subunit alpha
MHTKDADVVVVAYGSVSRCAKEAVRMARELGWKVGIIRPITIWPFPEKRIKTLASKVKAFVVPEINYGQIAFEVERSACGMAKSMLIPKMGGSIHTPEEILNGIEEMIS